MNGIMSIRVTQNKGDFLTSCRNLSLGLCSKFTHKHTHKHTHTHTHTHIYIYIYMLLKSRKNCKLPSVYDGIARLVTSQSSGIPMAP